MDTRLKNKGAFDYESIDVGYYDAIFNREKGAQSKWHHLKFETVRHAMGDYETHLDIGCGPGTFIRTLDQNRRSIGVDVAAEQVNYASTHYKSTNHNFTLIQPNDALPFDDQLFDVVTIIELLEHLSVEQCNALLKEVNRVLKPGGRLIATTPNYRSCWPLMEWIVNRVTPVSYREQHITHFTQSRLYDLMKTHGLSDIGVEPFQWLASFTAVLNWKLADWIKGIETPFLEKWFGVLLIAQARRPLER